MMKMGITFTVMGTAGLAASAAMIATAKQEVIPPACPVGCSGDIRNSYQQVAGAGLLGASLFGVMLGAPMWALGSLDEPPEQGRRMSDDRFLVGAGLSIVGAAATAAGAFAGLADRRGDWASIGVPFTVIGTTSMMIGIPLWVSGSRRKPPSDGPPMVRRSRGVMAGGIAITMVGAATMGASAIVASFAGGEKDIRSFVGATTFLGLGLVLAGIPMWYFGQENVPEQPWSTSSTAEKPRTARSSPRPALPPPEINIGPTGVSMRLVF